MRLLNKVQHGPRAKQNARRSPTSAAFFRQLRDGHGSLRERISYLFLADSLSVIGAATLRIKN